MCEIQVGTRSLMGSVNKLFNEIQDDSKRWTQFRTSIFPELYMVCEWST